MPPRLADRLRQVQPREGFGGEPRYRDDRRTIEEAAAALDRWEQAAEALRDEFSAYRDPGSSSWNLSLPPTPSYDERLDNLTRAVRAVIALLPSPETTEDK
jgi:hypothetical protein